MSTPAQAARRKELNVHSDVARLAEPGPVERDSGDKVFLPFDAVEPRLALAQAA